MSRRVILALRTLLGACAVGVLLGGCASAPPAGTARRFDDTSFGLMPENRFPGASPLVEQRDWRLLTLADESTYSAEVKAEDPVTASGGQHHSWVAESPMAGKPKRGRFFLSGFVAGFMARLAYGAYQGAGAHGVSGNDLGSSIAIGTLAGLATWSFSFRLSPGQMTKTTPEQEVPRLEDSSVYRDWTTGRR
jgi:hypothetical protein